MEETVKSSNHNFNVKITSMNNNACTSCLSPENNICSKSCGQICAECLWMKKDFCVDNFK